MLEIQDKIVLITGSSSGIGAATAKLFAEHDAYVIITCKTNTIGAQSVTDAIMQSGGKAEWHQADLAREEQVEKLFAHIKQTHHRLDILINNAGVARAKDFPETTYDDWLNDFNDNFFSTVLCSREAAKLMQDQKSGIILNTSSIRGELHNGREGIMAYSAAKAAVNNFSKTLAKLLAPHIRVNAVSPGFTYTPYYDTMTQEVIDGFISKSYTKRFIEPKEIAEAFFYLATAPSVTGEILTVDGGYTLKDG